jgi:diguanylate cyclase (GGDEF)-like protein
VAIAMAERCRTTDFICRYGGEEFAIVVPEEGAAGAAKLAQRCRQAVEATSLTVGDVTVRVTVSLGGADSTDADTVEMLIEQADEALYQAKEAGRNQVAIRQHQIIANSP